MTTKDIFVNMMRANEVGEPVQKKSDSIQLEAMMKASEVGRLDQFETMLARIKVGGEASGYNDDRPNGGTSMATYGEGILNESKRSI